MTVDLDKLEALARAATPGPWMAYQVYACNGAAAGKDVATDGGAPLITEEHQPGDDDAEYIAAANPATILDLLALARRAPDQATGAPAPVCADERQLPSHVIFHDGVCYVPYKPTQQAAPAQPATDHATGAAGADERALFEAHFMSEGWDGHSFERYNIYDPNDESSYKNRHVADMWDGWQACAATPSPSAPQVQEGAPAELRKLDLIDYSKGVICANNTAYVALRPHIAEAIRTGNAVAGEAPAAASTPSAPADYEKHEQRCGETCPVCTEGKLIPLHMHLCDKCGLEVGTDADATANVKAFERATQPAASTPDEWHDCPDCDGSGRISPAALCNRCNQSGILPAAASTPSAPTDVSMPISQEPKYGIRDNRLYNRASGEFIPADEPVFIFRARDTHAVNVLAGYAREVHNADHSKAVRDRVEHFKAFWNAHPGRMKQPDTAIPTTDAQPAASSGIGAVAPEVDDLAALIRQLAYSLKKASPNNDLAKRAVDYLRKKDLLGSPLRAADAPQQAADAARLDFMIQHEAWVAFGEDGESCRVFSRNEDGDAMPMLGWGARHWRHDPREAIDAARAAMGAPQQAADDERCEDLDCPHVGKTMAEHVEEDTRDRPRAERTYAYVNEIVSEKFKTVDESRAAMGAPADGETK